MSEPERTSEWLLRTVIAATFAVLGFFGKDLYEDWKLNRAAATASLEQLKELSSLLDESYSIYISQNDQAKRLLAMLHRNHGKDVPDNLGYDATFYALFDRFSADEAELQGMIRSTTMNSQRRVNQALSEWLQTAAAFKRGDQPSAPRLRLSQQLLALELHLNQWHDKYEAWMPNDNKRSLVYLADEKGHGAGFPRDLHPVVKEVIATWK